MLLESRHEVEIAHMERVLRGYGVLTRERLIEFSGGTCYPVNLRIVLEEAIRSGRIIALGDKLVELPPPAA